MLDNATQARYADQDRDKADALMYIGHASPDLNRLRGESSHKLIPIYSETTDV